MKVSLIIPTLNEEKNIVRLINSIKKNTSMSKKYYEIIVIDGNSKDKTLQNARKHADKAISLKKRGIGLARNVGFKKSKGELLIFIDADVEIDSDVITNVYDYFIKSKNVCGTIKLRVSLKGLWPKLVFKVINFLIKVCARVNKPHAFGAFLFFGRKLFKKIDGFKEDIDGFEDHEIVKRASEKAKFVYLDNQSVIFDGRRLEKLGTNKWIIISIGYLLKFYRSKESAYKTIDEL